MLKFGRQTATDTARSPAGTRTPEGEEQLKRRARQRLIGALILVLTTVIVLPMVLDSEPRPVNPGIEVRIPAKDAPFEPKLETAPPGPAASIAATPTPAPDAVAPGPTPAPPTGAQAPAASAVEERPAVVAPPAAIDKKPQEAVKPVETKPVETKPVETKPVETKPVETRPAEAKPAETKPTDKKTDSKADGKADKKGDKKPAESKPADKPAADAKGDGAKAQALLEGKPGDKQVTDKVSERAVVQIGAFASVDKVHELQAKLKAAGISTYTEKVKTDAGERIRLRAGPYAQRAEAQAMLAKIDAAGVHGAKVVSP